MIMVQAYSKICIITNGLLLLSLSEEFYQIFKDYNIVIDITVYPPLREKMDRIISKLKKLNMKSNHVNDCINNPKRYKTSGGYHWIRYKEENMKEENMEENN